MISFRRIALFRTDANPKINRTISFLKSFAAVSSGGYFSTNEQTAMLSKPFGYNTKKGNVPKKKAKRFRRCE